MGAIDNSIPIGFYQPSTPDKQAVVLAHHISLNSRPMHKDVHLLELGEKVLLFVVNDSPVEIDSHKLADNIRKLFALLFAILC